VLRMSFIRPKGNSEYAKVVENHSNAMFMRLQDVVRENAERVCVGVSGADALSLSFFGGFYGDV